MLSKRWIPAIFVMVLIFCFSSIPEKQVTQISQPGINEINQITLYIIHKPSKGIEWLNFGHAIGYFLLAISFQHALKQYPKLKVPHILAFFLCVTYALTDEFHQYFVPGRSADLKDILIDTIAAGAALLVISLASQIIKRKRPSNKLG